ncbi:DUF4026 domain-containing protein [Flavobacterium sp. I3-2]|uniref:DUF4026 domain-containing protein n=1 Tax=Flavobacterium sp. I3-2 TaxID=2748319 RepID=UPI0015AEBE2C|nr:DUF4026 domain-containing protein [Flavobacterium sp. I3-2]
MEEEKDLYELIETEGIRLASEMAIFPSDENFVFEENAMKTALENRKDFKLVKFETAEIDEEDREFILQKYQIEVEYQEVDFHLDLMVFVNYDRDLDEFQLGNRISDEEREAYLKQKYFLETSQYFSDDYLDSYHLQLKVMQAIVEKPSVVFDYMPMRILSGKWVEITSKSHIPPAPSYLYVIHSVYEGEEDNRSYWLHTHGLHRCNAVELEFLNIKSGAQQFYDVLNIVATSFLTSDTKKQEDEIFDVGYDGLGLSFCWQRWEKSVMQFPPNILGGLNERNPEEENYGPSGVLFAVQEDEIVSPEIYAKTLADNPMYFISDAETERMAALAYDRFHSFKKVFLENFNANQDEKDAWSFLVKLGIQVDSGDSREHLWFEVSHIDELDNITGLLLNQPYWIEALKQNDVKTYSLDFLTDWIIYGSETNYTPDTIYELI